MVFQVALGPLHSGSSEGIGELSVACCDESVIHFADKKQPYPVDLDSRLTVQNLNGWDSLSGQGLWDSISSISPRDMDRIVGEMRLCL